MMNQNLPVVVKNAMRNGYTKIHLYSKKIWVRLILLGFVLFIISTKEMSLELKLGNGTQHEYVTNLYDGNMEAASMLLGQTRGVDQPKIILAKNDKTTWSTTDKTTEKESKKDNIKEKLNLANSATAVSNTLTAAQQKKAMSYSNLGFILSPNFAKKHKVDPKIVAYKNKKCTDYIARYVKTAQEEAKIFKIPASITLAQGLLESNAGDSRLALNENNHFGIKCRKKCIGCRCANYTDDSRYDMFRIFDSPWMSFREHSKLLSGKRYRHLKKLKATDYKGWAHGLKKAGYATDKKYAYKLISIIEKLKLYKYDQ